MSTDLTCDVTISKGFKILLYSTNFGFPPGFKA